MALTSRFGKGGVCPAKYHALAYNAVWVLTKQLVPSDNLARAQGHRVRLIFAYISRKAMLPALLRPLGYVRRYDARSDEIFCGLQYSRAAILIRKQEGISL